MTAEVIQIEALTHPAEQPALVAAAEQLSEWLGAATGAAAWPVRLSLRPPGDAAAVAPGATVVIASLLPELGQPSAAGQDAPARWGGYLGALEASGAPIFICTIFRHVADRRPDGRATPLLERIRRLNRMAFDLSRARGVGVIDIDRAFAHIGARPLGTDYRLGGVLAAEVAGHAIAWSLLSGGLDAVVPAEAQETARARLGDLSQIDRIVSRRLERRQKAAAHG